MSTCPYPSCTIALVAGIHASTNPDPTRRQQLIEYGKACVAKLNPAAVRTNFFIKIFFQTNLRQS